MKKEMQHSAEKPVLPKLSAHSRENSHFFLLYLEGSEGMGHNAPNTFPMKVDRPQEQELPDTGSSTFGGTASQIS